MAEEANTREPQQPPGFTRTDDFVSEYANNFQFEQSVFDLKLIFGQLDQSKGPAVVEQHTSVTIPWISAKLLLYYLQLNIAGYELQNGKIKIPPELLPPSVGPLPEEQQNDPKAQQLFQQIEKIREQFMSNL